jgi:hypothetical protein
METQKKPAISELYVKLGAMEGHGEAWSKPSPVVVIIFPRTVHCPAQAFVIFANSVVVR